MNYLKPNGKLEGIGNIFLINHNNLKERLIFQQNQFKDLNLRFTRIESIEAYGSTNFITPQVKSCYLSHLAALQRCANYQRPCLILEDDVIINFNMLREYLNNILNNPEIEWDIIYFYPPPEFENPTEIPVDNLICKISYMIYMHAYLINPKIIGDVIDKLKRGIIDIESNNNYRKDSTHIDRFMSENIHPKYQLYTSTVPIIYQDKIIFGSSLGCLTQEQKTKYRMRDIKL